MLTLDDTGERMIPLQVAAEDSLTRQLLEHSLERYRKALPYVGGKRVLDIACGSGYGSRMLLDAGAREVVGVDLSPEAVGYAEATYGCPGLRFVASDAMSFEGGGFDVITSFETLEHVPDPRLFLATLRSRLGPGGLLLLSASTVPTSDLYVFHLHDFDADELRRLVREAGLEICDELEQHDRFTPRQVRLALRLHTGSLPPSRILR
nr:class I SAM-dependent methyltransferase [Thermoanaerobaculia bacterium]